MINMAPKYSVFLFYLVLSWTEKQCIADGVDCCKVCSCVFNSRHSGTTVNCQKKGLSSIPSNIPLNTYGLDLSNNRLITVRNYSFIGLKSLRFLNLGMNKIALLEKNAFTGLDKLRVLRLNQNILLMNYTTYPEMVFHPLSGLQELYIEDNFDKTDGEYADKIFKPLQKLKILQLDTFSNPTFGKGFTYLKHLRRLLIGGSQISCSMTILKNKTFKAFRAAPLDELVMTFCPFHLLEAGSFQFFPYLSILNIRENGVGVKNVLRSLNTLRNRNMTEINISNVRFEESKKDLLRIDDSMLTDVIQYLANICVTKIDLSRNGLIFIDLKLLTDERFLFRKCIEYIDVSFNRLDQSPVNLMINILRFSNLRILDISQQFQKYKLKKHDRVSEIQQELTSDISTEYFTNADHEVTSLPDSRENYIKLNMQYFITLPPNLVKFYIGNTLGSTGQGSISFSQNGTVINGSMLRVWDMSYFGIREFTGTMVGLENLQKLDISGNDGTRFSELFFDTFPSLQYLYLNDMSIGNDFIFWHGRRLFKNLAKLKSLNLANNNLILLPRDIFVDNINLEHLDLSFNRFQSLPLTIINLNALTSIVMTFNSISYLNKEERDALDMKTISNPVHIYLDGNVFACGCESRSSIMWLFETNVVLDNKGNYSCISEDGLVTTTSAMIDQIELLFRTCSGKLWLFVGLCGLTLMLATFLSVMLISRLKTRIIYWIFKVLGNNVEIPKRNDFEYDLFVLHADSEYQWPCYTMRSNLEEDPRRNIRLCLKERNILPGGAKAESIVECLYSSWKSAIILTPEFVADEWCIFAMRAAIYSISTQMPSRVIVLWEESMTVQLVPEELLAVLDEQNIIRFSWQVDNNDRFWHDLHKMIID